MANRTQFDFNEWSALARNDPAQFEQMRDELLQEFIGRAPPDYRQRLSGLQFRIDMERRKAKTPLAACIRLSQLMMDKVQGEFLPLLSMKPEAFRAHMKERRERIEKARADVIPFPPRHGG